MSVSCSIGTYDEAIDALTFSSKTNSNLIGIKSLSESTKSLSSNSSKSSSSVSARSFKNYNFLNNNTNLTDMNDNTNSSKSNLCNQNDLVQCPLCKKRLNEPKLLSCLHVFCKNCLIAHSISESRDNLSPKLSCPKCKQETLLNSNGIDGLEDDCVMLNILDMIAMEEKMLDCTSCETEEKSIARCTECAQFLCPGCVNAHKKMKCFEKHSVVEFDKIKKIYRDNLNRLIAIAEEEQSNNNKSPGSHSSPSSSSSKSTSSASSSSSKLNDDQTNLNFYNDKSKSSKLMVDVGVPIHKPLFCKIHSKEVLKSFCNNCQVPVCSDCIVTAHRQHSTEIILDERNLDELDSYIKKAKENISFCQSEFQLLDQYLADLQEQLESNKGLIEETYQSYKVILERKKDELIKELEEKHSSKELSIMDLHNSIDMSINQLNDVIKFSDRITKNGNISEILLLKKSIINQIKHLTSKLPQIETLDINLKFVSDEERFEKAISESFGRFYTQKEIKKNYLNSLQNNQIDQNRGVFQQYDQLQQQQNQQHLLDQDWYNQMDKFEQLQQLKTIQFDENLLKNLNQLSSLNNNTNSNVSPLSPTSLNEEWLLNMVNDKIPSNFDDLQQNLKQIQQQLQLTNLAGLSPKSASQILSNNQKLTAKQQQIILSSLQQNNIRSQSPFDANALQLNLLNNQQSTSSRSHTPMLALNGLKQLSNLNDLNSIGSGSSLGSSAGSSNININQPNQVINTLDEFLPFQNSNITQNLNQLSKYINSGTSAQDAVLNNLNDLTTLNNLNELAFTAGLNINNYPDANSNSSQSPPTGLGAIGSGMVISTLNTSGNTQTTFSGNGNLNPPVRQNNKMNNMQIRTKFGSLGGGKSQFNSPHGFCLGIDEEIIVADTNNHRIEIFDKNGEFKYSFGSPGREEGQLWYPRKVTVMRDTGKFVVCDRGNERSRMQIFNKSGHFLRKISIRYIDIVAGLAITQNGDIVAVDSVSPTVFRISENGDLLKWFDCSDYMREPSDIAINGNEYYVCDFKGHCVAVFNEDGNFIRRIGGENITNFPNGIDVSDAGDVLVGDSHGNRFHVAVFSREGTMLSEFECPYVKVSRCCGLKITSEGYIVTLAKNNHHVLVLNTLYVA